MATAPVARARVNFGIAQYASRGEGPVLAVAIRGGMMIEEKEDERGRGEEEQALCVLSSVFIGFSFFHLFKMKKTFLIFRN